MSLTLSVLLIATIALISPLSAEKCTRDSECSQDQCCLLPPSRYAIPNCMSYQLKDEPCRVNAETITANLSYPDHSQLEVKSVSYILCPCAEGLSCNPKRGICN